MRYNKKKTPSRRINMNGPQSFSVMSFVVYHFLLHVRSQLKTKPTYVSKYTHITSCFIYFDLPHPIIEFVRFFVYDRIVFFTYANLTWTDTEKV